MSRFSLIILVHVSVSFLEAQVEGKGASPTPGARATAISRGIAYASHLFKEGPTGSGYDRQGMSGPPYRDSLPPRYPPLPRRSDR